MKILVMLCKAKGHKSLKQVFVYFEGAVQCTGLPAQQMKLQRRMKNFYPVLQIYLQYYF